MSEYAPLIDVWARDGEASVVVALLQDAGFFPVIECDPRGWMHYYGWPLGSSRPLTVWIPASDRDEAMSFLAAPFEPLVESGTSRAAARTSDWRRIVLGLWLFEYALMYVGLFLSSLWSGIRTLLALLS